MPRPSTVIGRSDVCDLRVPLPQISRKHCRLFIEDDGLYVEDMGSSNGTFVNGKRVQKLELEAGDTVQIGPVAFVVRIDDEPSEDQLQPIRLQAKGSDKPRSGGAPLDGSEDISPTTDQDFLEILEDPRDEEDDIDFAPGR